IRSEARLAHLLDAFRELTASPGALARVAALTAAGMAAKLAAAACVAASLGVERPVVAALVIVPAVELAAVLPLTPGNIGVSSAAVALALASLGVAPDTALAAGIAFGALETLAALAAGAAGMLLLTAPRVRPMVRRAAVGTALGAVSWAIVLTAVPGV
ncbi:MAG: lysylphosphatidylglycerol synthase domain-containing protein, partial [Thermoleophilia bacterium]|nr:lysylphosphatidylglycerol synthase domain-containing protein [Thermoleophilia bacterium]